MHDLQQGGRSNGNWGGVEVVERERASVWFVLMWWFVVVVVVVCSCGGGGL